LELRSLKHDDKVVIKQNQQHRNIHCFKINSNYMKKVVIAKGSNVIDFDNLTLHEPEVLHDLPAGGRRLVQKASGYEYTIVSGQIAFENGEATGALNGRLIRNQIS
jgi:hypothetical protein